MKRPALTRVLRSTLLAVPGVASGGSVFGGIEGFWIDARLVAELIDSSRIQLRLTKPVIRELRDTLTRHPGVELRKNSDWVTLRFQTKADAAFAARLMEAAAPRYRPPAGAVPRPPPEGADLERRRRWH